MMGQSGRPRLGLRFTPQPATEAEPTVKVFDNYWLIYRRHPKGYRLAARPPRHRHPTFEQALIEATRLAQLFPESTFVLLQERAVVTMKDAA